MFCARHNNCSYGSPVCLVCEAEKKLAATQAELVRIKRELDERRVAGATSHCVTCGKLCVMNHEGTWLHCDPQDHFAHPNTAELEAKLKEAQKEGAA
jgi:hypothetical protein